jgi:hypothetical protein
MKYKPLKYITLILSTLAVSSFLRAGPPSAADVGEAESFGHAALYMGAMSGAFNWSPNPCGGPPPVPGDTSQCFQLNPAPAQTTATAEDVSRIKLPKKATRTIIYPAMNFFVTYELENTTGVDQPQGEFFFRSSLDIESDVLLDPSIIDPSTGLPAAGKLRGLFTYTYRDDRSMRAGDRQRQQMTLVRVGNAGLTKASFVAGGLTQAQADSLFASQITVHLNFTTRAKLLKDAMVTGNVRLFGD